MAEAPEVSNQRPKWAIFGGIKSPVLINGPEMHAPKTAE